MLRGRLHRAKPEQILVVCTGNICRSPYICARLAAALPHLRVESAGTQALAGQAPAPQVVRALRAQGLDVSTSRARQLTTRDVRQAALVVTASRVHRVRVEQLDPTAAARVFTLKELARVLTRAPADGALTDLVAAAAAAAHAESIEHDDDLADPYGLEDAAYEQMFATADAALDVLVPALRGRVTA